MTKTVEISVCNYVLFKRFNSLAVKYSKNIILYYKITIQQTVVLKKITSWSNRYFFQKHSMHSKYIYYKPADTLQKHFKKDLTTSHLLTSLLKSSKIKNEHSIGKPCMQRMFAFQFKAELRKTQLLQTFNVFSAKSKRDCSYPAVEYASSIESILDEFSLGS